ncbi:hypothetical protein SAMN05216258_1192 [Albimonas pacifica]|uniref:Uncharacterized protein n=2 Tax=Albimonas pacifica TaxID=1114924 RepID=A0A1I3PPR5_9RHOB|nr:hypothetical protein SAMN05216258_1192 [Albimonas pacifica]
MSDATARAEEARLAFAFRLARAHPNVPESALPFLLQTASEELPFVAFVSGAEDRFDVAAVIEGVSRSDVGRMAFEHEQEAAPETPDFEAIARLHPRQRIAEARKRGWK